MEHKDLLQKSMDLLEEAMSSAFKQPGRMNPESIEQIDANGNPINKIAEEMSDDEIDAAMNKNAPQDPQQVKLRKALEKKKKETPAQRKAREAAEAVAKSDSES